jgi:hypothetical protein
VVQPDGRIVAGGIRCSTPNRFALVRYDPDGKIVAGGGDGGFALARYLVRVRRSP